MFCEYCEADAIVDDEVLGSVCEICLEQAIINEDQTGTYAVGVEEDYDLILDGF